MWYLCRLCLRSPPPILFTQISPQQNIFPRHWLDNHEWFHCIQPSFHIGGSVCISSPWYWALCPIAERCCRQKESYHRCKMRWKVSFSVTQQNPTKVFIQLTLRTLACGKLILLAIISVSIPVIINKSMIVLPSWVHSLGIQPIKNTPRQKLLLIKEMMMSMNAKTSKNSKCRLVDLSAQNDVSRLFWIVVFRV